MSSQLDILALEPFFGGARRNMLETLVRCSRHRWTVLKLPPRRLERRLTAAANWFSEQLSRHWVGRVDLLFTSEAMNLANLFQLMPALTRHPSVVYFHDNQLPDVSVHEDRPLDLVNLNTATAATEIWFNSNYNRRTFLARASALVERHLELAARSPIPELTAKSRLVPPPVDLSVVHEIESGPPVARDPARLFVETRGADMGLLNDGLRLVQERGTPLHAITVGPADELDPNTPRTAVSEYDEKAQVRAMFEAGVVLSVKPEAACDFQAIRAMVAGCRPVLPDGGVYPEIVPAALHQTTLYEISPDALADKLQDALDPSNGPWHYDGFRQAFRPMDAITACRTFDERVEQLVTANLNRR